MIAVALRFFAEQASARLRWVEWAEDVTRERAGVTPGTGARVPTDAVSTEAAAREG